jgi:superfamily II DNA helicase RecQ
MATIDTAIALALQQFKVDRLKAEQKVILQALLSGEDGVAVLPTGCGKSLPYIPVLKELKRDNVTCDENSKKPIVLVCCPLIALMEDQVRRLRAIPSVNAEFIGL